MDIRHIPSWKWNGSGLLWLLRYVYYKIRLHIEIGNCFVCLFVWSFSSHSRIFHSLRDVTNAGEGLQILTFARHLWPLSNESSLAYLMWHGDSFIMAISEKPWHSHLMPSVWQWSCHYLFSRLRSFAAGIRTLNLPFEGRTRIRIVNRNANRKAGTVPNLFISLKHIIGDYVPL